VKLRLDARGDAGLVDAVEGHHRGRLPREQRRHGAQTDAGDPRTSQSEEPPAGSPGSRDRGGRQLEAATIGADSDTTPDGADGRADRARLLDALDTLPSRQRSAVVLRHWLDLSEQECARELGCSVGTVKSLASRGRAALRLSLENA